MEKVSLQKKIKKSECRIFTVLEEEGIIRVGVEKMRINPYHYEKEVFNEDGQKIEEEFYMYGRINKKKYIFLGSKCRKIDISKNIEKVESETEYDDKGNVLVYRSMRGDKLILNKSFLYDEKNRKKQVVEYDISGGFSKKRIYEYHDNNIEKSVATFDENGRKTEEFIYNHKGDVAFIFSRGKTKKVDSFYDARGNEVRKIFYDEHGQVQREYLYNYNEKNLCTLELCEDKSQKKSYSTKSIFDDFGRLIQKIYSPYDLWFGKQEHFKGYEYFDRSGSWIAIASFDKQGNLLKSKSRDYSYDLFGNWIEMKVNEDNKPSYVIKREIEYY